MDPDQRGITVITAMIVTSALILVTVAFERGKEFLTSRAGESLLPLLNNMLSELTVLGFIGLIMFLTTKFGRARLDQLVGEPGTGLFVNVTECYVKCGSITCEENPLIELSETVHMVIFLVMITKVETLHFSAQRLLTADLSAERLLTALERRYFA